MNSNSGQKMDAPRLPKLNQLNNILKSKAPELLIDKIFTKSCINHTMML
jgi:hypothetical protein